MLFAFTVYVVTAVKKFNVAVDAVKFGAVAGVPPSPLWRAVLGTCMNIDVPFTREAGLGSGAS